MLSFNISQDAVVQRRKFINLTTGYLRFMTLGMALFMIYFGLRLTVLSPYGMSSLGIFLLIFPVGFALFAFIFPARLKKQVLARLASQQLHLTETGIERSNGDWTEYIPYDEVTDFSVHRDTSGELVGLKLGSKTKVMQLERFEHMEALLDALKTVLPDVEIKTETQRIGFGALRIIFIVLIIATVAMLGLALLNPGLFLNFNRPGVQIFEAIFLLGTGLFVLLRRPVSSGVTKEGSERRHGALQLVFGLISVGFAIYLIFF